MPEDREDIEFRLKNRLTSALNKETNSNVDKLVRLQGGSYEDLYLLFDELLAAHDVRNSSGLALDNIGRIFKEKREPGEDDTTYRTRIMQIVNNLVGGGTREALIRALQIANPELNEEDVIIEEFYTSADGHTTAHIRVFLTGNWEGQLPLGKAIELLERTRAAGVKIDNIGIFAQDDQPSTDRRLGWELTKVIKETQPSADAFSMIVAKTLKDQQASDDSDDPLAHFSDVTYSDSLNITS